MLDAQRPGVATRHPQQIREQGARDHRNRGEGDRQALRERALGQLLSLGGHPFLERAVGRHERLGVRRGLEHRCGARALLDVLGLLEVERVREVAVRLAVATERGQSAGAVAVQAHLRHRHDIARARAEHLVEFRQRCDGVAACEVDPRPVAKHQRR